MAGMQRSRLCVTLGDPTGVGPELTATLLRNNDFCRAFQLTVIGDVDHLQQTAASLNSVLPPQLAGNDETPVRYVQISDRTPGAIAYRAIEKAVQLIRQNQADGMVTGPISKANLRQAGYRFSGHTEMLQHFAHQYFGVLPDPTDRFSSLPRQSDMVFTDGDFRVFLLTRHVPLSQVSQSLSVEGVTRSLVNLVGFLRNQEGIESPNICMLGVNPHAGEIGGHEERDILIPACQAIKSRFPSVRFSLPQPADAAFRGMNPSQPAYDAYVAAYHDQGLIPMKLLAGFRAVNVTIGLPFVRTSVSHGMASDIAGQGIAVPDSLYAAVTKASQLIQTTHANAVDADTPTRDRDLSLTTA